MNTQTAAWYHEGIDGLVLRHLAKRFGKNWEDGVFHHGGIHTGSWFVCGNKTGMRLRAILDLYESEAEFLFSVESE
jgi:hypothetical protein